MEKEYDYKAAARFWSKRLGSTDPLAAVLSYNAPKILNLAYNKWELESLKKVLPDRLSGKTAVDIACGTGRVALTMARMGAEVIAVDLSTSMLSHLRRQAVKQKVVSKINLVNCSSDSLPIEGGSFDIVTCFGLLEHLPQKMRKETMIEAFRVLKPRGKMYVVINNADCIFIKDRYKMKQQRKDGYFVSLVGLKWLKDVCTSYRMKTKLAASNPLYTIAHYMVGDSYKGKPEYRKNFGEFCESAVRLDCLGGFDSSFSEKLASHYLIEIKRA